MANAELIHCPFCGGEAELRVQNHIPNGYDYTPRCKEPSCCGRLTKKYSSKEAAIYAWNRRANTIPVGNGENYEVKHNDR